MSFIKAESLANQLQQELVTLSSQHKTEAQTNAANLNRIKNLECEVLALRMQLVSHGITPNSYFKPSTTSPTETTAQTPINVVIPSTSNTTYPNNDFVSTINEPDTTDRLTILGLPMELQSAILEKVGLLERYTLQRVCRDWRRILRDILTRTRIHETCLQQSISADQPLDEIIKIHHIFESSSTVFGFMPTPVLLCVRHDGRLRFQPFVQGSDWRLEGKKLEASPFWKEPAFSARVMGGIGWGIRAGQKFRSNWMDLNKAATFTVGDLFDGWKNSGQSGFSMKASSLKMVWDGEVLGFKLLSPSG